MRDVTRASPSYKQAWQPFRTWSGWCVTVGHVYCTYTQRASVPRPVAGSSCLFGRRLQIAKPAQRGPTRAAARMRVVVSQVSFEHLTLPKEGPSTVSVVLLSNEEGSAPLASAELAGSSDVVLSVTATLPSLDGGLKLQVQLPGGEDGPVPLCTADLIALGVGAPGASEGRLLRVPLELAEAPPAAAAAKAPPPAKGKKGAAAPAATEAAPAADCSFSCFWRVEPDFMDVSLERCHPLAVRYFGSAFRDEARGRQMLWREGLRGERGEDNPGLGATRRYELSAPLKPSPWPGRSPASIVT